MMRHLGSDELNWALGLLSFVLWTGAYIGYFARDIRVWFWRYQHRRQLAAIRRAQGHWATARYTRAPRHRAWRPPDLATAATAPRDERTVDTYAVPIDPPGLPAPPQLNGE
jgi:hypothetical protein